jgi:hypothetical protein
VARQRDHVNQVQHFAFAKSHFEFLVVNARITFGDDQDDAIIAEFEGQGFGNTPRFYAMRFSSQGDGGSAHGQFNDGQLKLMVLKKIANRLEAHDRWLNKKAKSKFEDIRLHPRGGCRFHPH